MFFQANLYENGNKTQSLFLFDSQIIKSKLQKEFYLIVRSEHVVVLFLWMCKIPERKQMLKVL